MRFLVSVGVALLLAGCATARGPDFGTPAYLAAAGRYQPAQSSLFVFHASWVSGTPLGSTDSFHALREGVLFLTASEIVFAVYDPDAGQYRTGMVLPKSRITWKVAKTFGLARIVNVGTQNESYGFSIAPGYKSNGEYVGRDQVLPVIERWLAS